MKECVLVYVFVVCGIIHNLQLCLDSELKAIANWASHIQFNLSKFNTCLTPPTWNSVLKFTHSQFIPNSFTHSSVCLFSFHITLLMMRKFLCSVQSLALTNKNIQNILCRWSHTKYLFAPLVYFIFIWNSFTWHLTYLSDTRMFCN